MNVYLDGMIFVDASPPKQPRGGLTFYMILNLAKLPAAPGTYKMQCDNNWMAWASGRFMF